MDHNNTDGVVMNRIVGYSTHSITPKPDAEWSYVHKFQIALNFIIILSYFWDDIRCTVINTSNPCFPAC